MTILHIIKSIDRSPSRLALLLISLVVACFTLPERAHAVSPPPDGGYAGFNTAEGQKALFSLTTGTANTALGSFSLLSNTDGSFNTAVGAGTLLFNVGDQTTGKGTQNTALGGAALLFNTTGSNNTATGLQALYSNASGNANTAIGAQALYSNTTGGTNTAIGLQTLFSNTIGLDNTAIGFGALLNTSSGNDNTALGVVAGLNVATASNVICIGAAGADVSNSCYIGNIAGQIVGLGGSTCYVDNDGKLGVFLSARRFKTDIADMDNASAGLLALRPVTFHYKPELDKTGIPQFGLVAEEVAKVNPDLVTHDAKGEISTVRYEAVNVMLLNEFLKEHRKVEKQQTTIGRLETTAGKQEATIAELKSGVQALTVALREQAAQIQKVSAQLKASKPAPQIVNNP